MDYIFGVISNVKNSSIDNTNLNLDQLQSCEQLFTSRLKSFLRYNILTHTEDPSKLSTCNEKNLLIICIGYAHGHIDLSKAVKQHYLNNKISAIKTINGLFLTIIIDKSKDKSFVLTDSIGAWPIYYYFSNDTIFFSNQQKQLIFRLNKNFNLNQKVLYELFHTGIILPPDTLIEGIDSLPTTQYMQFDTNISLKFIDHPTPGFQQLCLDKVLELLITALDRIVGNEKEISVMCSGGLDSSLLVALLSKYLGKTVNLFTVAFSKQSNEYLQTQKLKQLFNTNNIYYYPKKIDEIWEGIHKSIWFGESDTVGSLSENASLEYLFTEFIAQKTNKILTGDDNVTTSLHKTQQFIWYCSQNYSILPLQQAHSWKILFEKKSPLYYFYKSRPFRYKNKYNNLILWRREFDANLIGKITSKFRLGLGLKQQYFYPLDDIDYARYINAINYHSDKNTYNHKNMLCELAATYNLLPKNFLMIKKAWMPSLLCYNYDLLQTMIDEVLQNDNISKTLFGKKSIKAIYNQLDNTYKVRFAATLFYLNQFYELFILKRGMKLPTASCRTFWQRRINL